MPSRFVVFFCLLIFSTSLSAATVLPGFSEKTVTTALSNPTAMAMAPDGRIFICEQGGTVRIVKQDVLLSEPFLTITVNSTGEKGLLGIAFDPNFSTNRFLYLYYTTNSPATHNRVSRFTANGDLAVAGSEQVIFELDNTVNVGHHGGALHFGIDKKLYIAVGDNMDPLNAQSFQNVFGKMLRINTDGTIPTDNPYYNTASGKYRAIWALGLRNPFTFAIQRGTGRILINDVGQESWEEINEGIKGVNYGWPHAEGPVSCGTYQCPLYYYGHGAGDTTGCAITGGVFYNPVGTLQFPVEYEGDYFFADFCNGWIRSLDLSNLQATTFATGIVSPVDLKISSAGSLYYLSRAATGELHRIRFSGGQSPVISTHPANLIVSVGEDASFTVTATGATPFNYQWQRNQVNIPGANASTYTLSSAQLSDDSALFRCIVSNSFGSVTSNAAELTVTSNSRPAATIATPTDGTIYVGGETIQYSGNATDPEDGTLPASAFTWQVDFHHSDHIHPFIPATTGSESGSFTVPTTGETSPNVWYRIILTVQDSGGLTQTVYHDVLPQKVNITLTSGPPGLQLKLGSSTVTTPFNFIGVTGITRRLEAISPQSLNGTTWNWSAWSDGGAIVHDTSTPSSDSTITATYTASTSANGLSGAYYDNSDFTGTVVNRVDAQIAFDWGSDAPIGGISADTFSVRWTGFVMPQYSETYTFHTNSNDGVRLWVNNQLIIDQWILRAGERSGTITLQAGQKYAIQLEYFESTLLANIRLYWSSASRPKQTIPSNRLFLQ